MTAASLEHADGNVDVDASGTPSCCGFRSSWTHRRSCLRTAADRITEPSRVRYRALAARHGACSHWRPRGKHVAANVSLPISDKYSSRGHVLRSAIAAALSAYLALLAGDSLSR
jgi:hypothetical protein